MTTTAVEVERKYDVPAETPVPELAGVAGGQGVDVQTHHLDAEYFDTDDLRLRAAGITLRRRTGGTDAGWHLKLPLGSDREEVRLLGDTSLEVPLELHVLVRARTRRKPLLPVAELTTTRTAHRLVDAGGRVLAELADDLVVGRTTGGSSIRWREWEVELVDGPPDVLDAVQERLYEAGAAPSTSASKVGRVLGSRPAVEGQEPWWGRRAVTSSKVTAGGVVREHLREQLEELIARDPQVRRDLPDALHKMRVATRRLRSALQTFRPLLDRTRTDPLRAELRWLAEVLGDVRDSEVMQARLQALVADEEPELVIGPVHERISAVLGARYRAAHDRVLSELEGERYLRLLDDLDALVADPPLLPAARRRASRELPPLVRRAWRRLDRQMQRAEAATGAEQDSLLHEARKDAKRARYAAEAVQSVYGAQAREYAKAITQLQEVLGEHQDGVVTRGMLLQLAHAADEAGESGFTFGRLHGIEQARAGAAAARWPEVHARAADTRLRRWLR